METEIELEQPTMRNDVVIVLPKNIKKYGGHIRHFNNRCCFEYVSRQMRIKEMFYFKDLGSKENAEQASIMFQKKWCQTNNMITNLYYIINNDYVEVELNNNVRMKVDLEDIPLIEEYNWRIQNNSSYPSTFNKDTDSGKRIFTSFQKMKFKKNKVHFKNKDIYDFRSNNIIV